MRKIAVSAFVSLDGVMQAPGGPQEDPTGGFKFGGWMVPYWDDVLGDAMGETFAEPFDLLLGRKTYDIFAAHWPYIQTDPQAEGYSEMSAGIARLFNGVVKHVATHRPDSLSWANSKALGGDIVTALRRLKAGDGPRLLTQGSSALIQTLLAHDLVDEFRLLTFPVMLGKGKRLFGSDALPGALAMTKSAISTGGVVIATYERAGAVRPGSFALDDPTEAEIERRKTLA